MKSLLPIVALVLASCGPVVESHGSSTRYQSFTDAEIAKGGTVKVVDDSALRGTMPNATHAAGIKAIEDVMRKNGFKPVGSHPDYVVKLEYGLDPNSKTWTYSARIHMWENVSPAYDYKWRGRGFSVCLPGEGGNDRMWMLATKSALEDFPR